MGVFVGTFQYFVGWGFVALMTVSCASSQTKERKAHRATLHLQMGISLMTNGKLPEALSEMSMAEQLNPKDPEIQNSLGLIYQLRGRMSEAEKRFHKALELKSNFTEVRSNLARLYIDTGKYKKALKELEIVEEDLTYGSPDKALVLKGMAYFKMSDLNRAENVLTKAYQMQRESCLGAYFLGRTYYEKKKLQDASQVLDHAISNCKNANFEEPLFYSAMSHYSLGDKMQAKARVEELLHDYPESPLSSKAKALLNIMDGI